MRECALVVWNSLVNKYLLRIDKISMIGYSMCIDMNEKWPLLLKNLFSVSFVY